MKDQLQKGQTWCIHPYSASVILSTNNNSCDHLDFVDRGIKVKWDIYISTPSQKICLHPDNRCNMVPHPLCSQGEDEWDCKEEYLKNELISEHATVKCESPHHNSQSDTATVTVYATPCDGREECFQGADEKNCRISQLHLAAISE